MKITFYFHENNSVMTFLPYRKGRRIHTAYGLELIESTPFLI